ncbi:MAG: hypothetical protein ACAH80_01060 [Alphaproteobacteria bacterium]
MTGDPGTAAIANVQPVAAPQEQPAAPPAPEQEPPLQPQEVVVPAEILTPTNTETIPEGLRYIIALPADNERAFRKLVVALAETPHGFRSLMPTDGATTTYTGIFTAMHGMAGQEEKTKLLNTVTYKIPFNDEVTKEVKGWGAKTPQQLEMLAAAYMETVKIQPGYKIRKMTPEEMKIIWYSSARDIYEPVFVVEDGDHRYVFDLNNNGEYLEFFEDLGKPCFNEMAASAADSESHMPCKCVSTVSDGNKYTVIFQGCKTKE